MNASSALPFALPTGPKVALNVGASETGRQWPAEYFAMLAGGLAARGFAPILVGAPSDRRACAAVQAASCMVLPSFAGKTSIPEMARLLAESELLVSADTGAAHIAAAVGTKVVGLYGSTAYFAETSPYGAGHLILQTRIGAPMSALAVDTVLAAALNRLGRLNDLGLRRELAPRGQAAWETDFLPPGADPLGGLCYRPLHRQSWTVDDLFTRALRHAFAREFCGVSGRLPLGDLWGASCSAGGDSAHTRSQYSALRQNADSLARALEQMHAAAATCAEMSTQRDSRSGIGRIAAKLTNGLDGLKSLTEKAEWAAFRPVVHYLDWRLRMMPILAPKDTFACHAREYRTAANLLLVANAVLKDALEGTQDRARSGVPITTSALMDPEVSRIAV
jgi:Glycosyltransferase family 9 (heptosyltransferase)